MLSLSDAALRHLQEVADWPDLSGTPYEIVEPLGRGGMGTVYRAKDHRLGREVALKVVSLDPGGVDRLLREAQVLARLEHPGIVPVHDAGPLPDGRAFYAMKLVRGRRLDEHVPSLTLAERLRAFLRICEAVAFAHAQGVIHRDLKPENVMVGPFGEVLVLDWGVAKVRPGKEALTPGPSPAAFRPTSPGEGKEALTPGPSPATSQPPSPGEGKEALTPGPSPAAFRPTSPGEGEEALTPSPSPAAFRPTSPGEGEETLTPGPSPAASQPPSPGEGKDEESFRFSPSSPGEAGRKAAGEEGRGGEGPGTAHGTRVGTPGFMAPEQERGEVEKIDERTDVWALGALLGFLLQGSEPPRPLEAIRRRAMAEEPAERYPTVEALAADLSLYLSGLPVGAHKESFFEKAGRFLRRYHVPILLVVAYVVMRALLLWIFGR